MSLCTRNNNIYKIARKKDEVKQVIEKNYTEEYSYNQKTEWTIFHNKSCQSS